MNLALANILSSPKTTIVGGVPSAFLLQEQVTALQADPNNWLVWLKLAISVLTLLASALSKDAPRS